MEEGIESLVSEFTKTYNRQSINLEDVKEWVDSFKGKKEYETLLLCYDFVWKENTNPDTHILSLGNHNKQKLIDYILDGSNTPSQ